MAGEKRNRAIDCEGRVQSGKRDGAGAQRHRKNFFVRRERHYQRTLEAESDAATRKGGHRCRALTSARGAEKVTATFRVIARVRTEKKIGVLTRGEGKKE